MKIQNRERRPTGFTLVELLCVMAIIALLAALLLPALALGKERAKRLVCVNNEREQGLAFHMFLHDHDSKFPMGVPMSEGGTEEFAKNGEALGGEFYFSYRHFQVLSNYSAVPQELVCPADDRPAAPNMGRLKNANLSYFVWINANYNQPESILAGDRNMTEQTPSPKTIHTLEPGSRLRWSRELHRYKGDVLFADGHVELWNQLNLSANLRGRSRWVVVFLPTVNPDSSSSSGDGYNRTAVASSSADQSGTDNGDSGPEPRRRTGGSGNPRAQTANPSQPRTSETPPAPVTTVVPLPRADTVSGAALPADGGTETTANDGTRPADGSGGFLAFTQSGWWFWLFLLVLLALAEAGRRLLKHKTLNAEEEGIQPTDD